MCSFTALYCPFLVIPYAWPYFLELALRSLGSRRSHDETISHVLSKISIVNNEYVLMCSLLKERNQRSQYQFYYEWDCKAAYSAYPMMNLMELLLLKLTEVVQSVRLPHGKIHWTCALKLLVHKTDFHFYNIVYRYLEVLHFYIFFFSIWFGISKKILRYTF